MEQAIAYIRVSDYRQVKDGNSLVSQERLVREYVGGRGYRFERLFKEEGETAKTDERPVLQELLAFAKTNQGQLSVLVIPKIDRLARNISDYLNLKLQFQRLGIRVESVGEQLLDSPVGRFTEAMLASVAQFDNEIRAERSKGGMVQAVTEGRWVWAAPRGYRNVRVNHRATIEPDPIIGRIIATAFGRLASGSHRPKDVLRSLHEQGVQMSRSQLHRMIRNKAYLGIICAFGLEARAAPPFVPLVSERIFYHAQQAFRRANQPTTYQRDHADFPLRGSVQCFCQRPLTACWSLGTSVRYPYYRCPTCSKVNIRKEELEKQFLAWLDITGVESSQIPRLKARLLEEWRRQAQTQAQARERLEGELQKLLTLRRSVALKTAQEIIPDFIGKEQIEELSVAIADKEASMTEISTDESYMSQVISFAVDFLFSLRSYWSGASLELKKRVQRFFFPEGFRITPERKLRTTKSDRLTGLKAFFYDQLSHLVDPMHEMTKNRSPKRQSVSSDTWLLLVKLYEQFSDILPPTKV